MKTLKNSTIEQKWLEFLINWGWLILILIGTLVLAFMELK